MSELFGRTRDPLVVVPERRATQLGQLSSKRDAWRAKLVLGTEGPGHAYG